MNQKYERIPIFRCRRKPECPEKAYQGGYGIGKPNSHTLYNHWLAALVKGKCSNTKLTRLATGVMSRPDTEQSRPYKICPWPCRRFEPGTYCTASENFTSVPHYSTLSCVHSWFPSNLQIQGGSKCKAICT